MRRFYGEGAGGRLRAVLDATPLDAVGVPRMARLAHLDDRPDEAYQLAVVDPPEMTALRQAEGLRLTEAAEKSVVKNRVDEHWGAMPVY